MSIADHFEQAPDARFIRDYDGAAARRQFNMSLMLIVVIIAAACALGFLVRFDSPAANTASIAEPSATGALPAPPAYAGRL